MSRMFPGRLRVGVTGHRLNQLPEAAHPAIREAVATALHRAGEAAREAADGHVKLTLVSALAEGADRIAAYAALHEGWRLVSPLPFRQARYEKDFPDSVDEFRSLYAKAAERHEIDGEALPGEAGGYAAVGREIVRRSDVLLAVWNGAPPKGPGGTAEVCALALAKGIAVLWIGPDGAPARLVRPEKARKAEGLPGRFLAALERRFEATPRPEAMRVAV